MSYTTGTAEDIDIYTTANSRELAETRMSVEEALRETRVIQTRMNILENKFNKAIEILTSRGINITEMI
jgi:ribosome biogenesis SPOUT family RNA methylase Rps3